MSPAGAFGLLRLKAQLLPVGLAVLVDEPDLRLGGVCEQRLRVRGGRVAGLLVVLAPAAWGSVGAELVVRGGEGHHDVSVQNAQSHACHRVFEVVLRGQAVVQAAV